MHYLNMLSLTHNFACTLRHTCLTIVTNVVAELVALCMGDQSILSRFTNDNSSRNNPTLHAQNQIIPEQFQLKHSKWVTRHTLIMLKLFSARLAHTGSRIQARLVQVTSLTVVAEYMLQQQAVRQGPYSSIHAVLQRKLRCDLT